ncbi:rlmN, partial [Symbiodinium microadriaticum]
MSAGNKMGSFEQREKMLSDVNRIKQKGVSVCVSSQAGCALDCSFCDTGRGEANRTYKRALSLEPQLSKMAVHSAKVLAALLAAACLHWSVAEPDHEGNCAMQVGIRRKSGGDFGDDDTPAKVADSPKAPATEATAEEPAAEEPMAEETAPEEPAAEEPAAKEPEAKEPEAEESAVEEPAVEEPVAEIPDVEETPATIEPADPSEMEEPAVEEASDAGIYSDAAVGASGAKKHPAVKGHGKWAQAHKKEATNGKASAGKSVGGKKAGQWAGKSNHAKAAKANAADSDFVGVMIDRFLNKKVPPKNEDVSEHAPLVFMHQHRAGGTTMRKLLYNQSVNMKLSPHIMCSGGVSCREFKNNDAKAAVYGGQFCWRELMDSLPEKKVSCLTNFREPVARIQSCYHNRLVHTKKIAPACMGKLEPSKLKSLLQNYGCVNEPFRRLGHCGLKPADIKDKKARMLSWNTTLEHLAECVPVLVDKQETYAAAVKYFPQFKQVFWQMKKLKLNENENTEECAIPDTHLAVIKELASEVKPAANLPAWAIATQVASVVEAPVHSVVFMGMGEPLLNYTEVSQAILLLQQEEALSRRWALTVSTVGVAPRIESLAADHPEVALAVSLHAPTQELRAQLLPSSSRRWSLAEVMQAVQFHEDAVGRVPMFAYTLLPGVNDSEANASELAELLLERRSAGAPRPFVNLVPYNATEAGAAAGYEVPTAKQLQDFRMLLRSKGLRATVRWSTTEGRAMGAACGQLAARSAVASQKQATDVPGDAESAPPGEALLTWRLHRSRREEALAIVREHESELNPIHISAAFVTLARSTARHQAPKTGLWEDEGFRSLLRRTEELLAEHFSAQCCANVIWSLAKLRVKPGKDFKVLLFKAAEQEISNFWPRNLANSLWAAARLRCRASGIGAGFFHQAAGRLAVAAPKMTPVEISNSVWALAQIRVEGSADFLDAIDASCGQLRRWKPQDISNTLWALAEFHYKPSREFMESLASTSHAKLEQFKADELAMSLRSFVRLQLGSDAALLPAAVRCIGDKAAELQPARLADAILAL